MLRATRALRAGAKHLCLHNPCQVMPDSCQVRTPHFVSPFRLRRLDGDAQMPSQRFHVTDATSGVPPFTPKASGSCRFAEAMSTAGGSSSTKQSSSSRTCNNPAGRPTKSDMSRANGLSAAQSVLSFDCPKLCRRKCEGLYMGYDEQAAKPALAAAIVASVRALRERLSLNSHGSRLKRRFGT